jgi:glycosyltransferase involved in cell wall biosynthesis
LIINFAFATTQATGLTTYASNLLPHLRSLDPTLLTSESISSSNEPVANSNCQDFKAAKSYLVPKNLTSSQGSRGHLNRLLWTQFQLPVVYKQLQASLLFSPIPEAPLFSDCRFIVTAHDLIPLRFPQRNPLTFYFRYYVPQVLKQAQHIICNSIATAQDVASFFEISIDRITPILLAYDADQLQFQNLPTQNYFIYVGRSDPHKNLQRLLTAFAIAARTLDCELWLVGPFDQRYTPDLITQAKELGLTDRIKFLNYVSRSELARLLNQAIALVFPSLWEGFGLPVLEAMACGTPVITSNLSSLPEVTGDAALLIDPYCEADLAAAMQTIAIDSKLRSQLRTAGLVRASQFSWAKTGAATAEVLQQYL